MGCRTIKNGIAFSSDVASWSPAVRLRRHPTPIDRRLTTYGGNCHFADDDEPILSPLLKRRRGREGVWYHIHIFS